MIVSTIEIFRTTIPSAEAANTIIQLLQDHFPFTRITVDLEDCDRVLRIAGDGINTNTIFSIVRKAGFLCEFLE